MRDRALAATAALVAGVACGGGGDEDSGSLRPLVEDIAPAVTALEAELGGPQHYFEINATPQLVNLFVAVDAASQVRAYVYVGDELGPPDPARGADGATFAAADLTFSADTILDGVADELPDSDIVVFSVIEGPAGEPVYAVTVESELGGRFDVSLDADGAVAAVTPG